MATFRINFAEAMQRSRSINNLSDDLQGEIIRLGKIEFELSSNWQSPAARTCLQQVRLLKRDMIKTRSAMRSLSERVASVARRIKKEDEAAAKRSMYLNN